MRCGVCIKESWWSCARGGPSEGWRVVTYLQGRGGFVSNKDKGKGEFNGFKKGQRGNFDHGG